VSHSRVVCDVVDPREEPLIDASAASHLPEQTATCWTSKSSASRKLAKEQARQAERDAPPPWPIWPA